MKETHIGGTRKGYWKTDGNGTIIGCDVNSSLLSETLAIPYKIGNEKITGIASGALNFLSNSESKVEKVIMINGVKQIAKAFAGLGIKEITIPGTIETISEEAFDECNKLEKVVIANGVKNINDRAFHGCDNLQNISLPNTLTHIGAYSFANDQENITSQFSSTVVIPGGVEYIGEGAFSYSGVSKIVCQEGVKTIGNGTFLGCRYLKEIILPNTLENIGDMAFACTALNETEIAKITIPASVSNIGTMVLALSKFEIDVDENNKVYSSQDGVLFNKDKTELIYFPTLRKGSYTVPNSVKTIGKQAFYACGLLEEIILQEGLERIEDEGLCLYVSYVTTQKLKNITIPNSVTYIGEGAMGYGTENIYFAPGNNPIPEGAPWGADEATITKLKE